MAQACGPTQEGIAERSVLGKELVAEGKKTWVGNFFEKLPPGIPKACGREKGQLCPHPSCPSHCLRGELASCCTSRTHTYTLTSGFRGFPYLSQTTFFPANKDHLSCLSQTTETTGRPKGVGGTLGARGLSVAGKPGPGPRKELLGWGRRRQNRPGITTPGCYPPRPHMGFRSRKLAWRKTPGPSLLRGGELGVWHRTGA